LAGIVLAVGLPCVSAVVTWILIAMGYAVHEWAGWAIGLWLAASTLAWRDLVDHVGRVTRALQEGQLPQAREAVGCIVGRDTDGLSEPEIVRATVESIAESASDGVVAPLLYLAAGGPPLALAFKAINTLDSMVGHLDERYREFGWASARLDDLVNWVPSRITAWLIVLASGLAGYGATSMGKSAAILLRDGHKHPSPNGGRPEAAMAGALGVQLGGINYYDGVPHDRPRLGDEGQHLSTRHVRQACTLMTVAYGLAVMAAAGYLWL
jgi:adenosylcobinamide-phosphate synthase